LIRRICFGFERDWAGRPPGAKMKLPPLPKWNSRTDDIDSADFLQRAQASERSRLPAGILFPRVGQVWETIRECEVPFQVRFSIQASAWLFKPGGPAKEVQALLPGGKARLAAGERVRIESVDDPERPLYVTFVPVRYEELYESIVPVEHRRPSSHYVLALRTAYTPYCVREERAFFTELFRLVGEPV